jgi:hypothetical protein
MKQPSPNPSPSPFAQAQLDKVHAQIKQSRKMQARGNAAAKKKKKNGAREGGYEASFDNNGPIGSGR